MRAVWSADPAQALSLQISLKRLNGLKAFRYATEQAHTRGDKCLISVPGSTKYLLRVAREAGHLLDGAVTDAPHPCCFVL